MAQEIVNITKETIQRLARDIKQLKREPLHSHGIYYEHSDTDILVGRALIIGAKDTPYEGGYYFFQFDFPSTYPHEPPKVKFLTNSSENVRMHPNLYRDGKTCLSILNTWYGHSVGDRWSGCQTISSILLILSSILTKDPLLHEPGVNKEHIDFNTYSTIIEYMNIKLGMIDILKMNFLSNDFYNLKKIAMKDLCDNFNNKIEILNIAFNNFKEHYNSDSIILTTSLYKINCNINYNSLLNNLENMRNDCKIELLRR